MADSYGEFDSALDAALAPRYRDRFVGRFESRDLPEGQFLDDIITAVEDVSGPLSEWQKFWIAGVVSGRGVEWSQTRRGSHYHIVGLPCPICGRR